MSKHRQMMPMNTMQWQQTQKLLLCKAIQSPFVIRYSFIASCCWVPTVVVAVYACAPINRLHLFSYIYFGLAFDFVCFVSFFGIFYFIFLCSCAFKRINKQTKIHESKCEWIREIEWTKYKINNKWKNLRNFVWLFENGM